MGVHMKKLMFLLPLLLMMGFSALLQGQQMSVFGYATLTNQSVTVPSSGISPICGFVLKPNSQGITFDETNCLFSITNPIDNTPTATVQYLITGSIGFDSIPEPGVFLEILVNGITYGITSIPSSTTQLVKFVLTVAQPVNVNQSIDSIQFVLDAMGDSTTTIKSMNVFFDQQIIPN